MTPAPQDEPRLVREVEGLERTAKVGESDKTPLILIGEMWVVSAIAVVVILGLAILGARLFG